MAVLGDLDTILGLHIRLAHGSIRRHFSEAAGDLDLTQKQVSVLWLIGANPGIAQTQISRLLQIDRASVMAIINHLQTRALLRRNASATDARSQALVLTDAGHTALAEARQVIGAHEDWLQARYAPAEVAQLIALLSRIHSPQ